MQCAQTLLTLFLITPCSDGAGGTGQAVGEALARAERPAADLELDPHRKPGEVLGFFGIEPGMSVLELFAGGGYYTEVLNAVVGPGGKVHAHNNAAYVAFNDNELGRREQAGRLPNVETVVAEANDLEFPAQQFDAALMILTYHDFLFSSEQFNWPDVDEHALLDQLCTWLKPGGVLGVVDHVANPGGDASEIAVGLHRVDPARVRGDIERHCFELVAESEVLANPDDDHTLRMSDDAIRWQTDRFVMKFKKRAD